MIYPRVLLLTLGLIGWGAGAASADPTLDKVRARGVIVGGIILSGPPYGYIDPKTQERHGFNVDLAQEIARRLGVALTIVPVTPPTRVAFLQQGKVDFLIANMEWTADRAEILSYAPTPFFRVGGAALVRKDVPVHDWKDLKGQTVCASQGSNYARPLAEEIGAEVKAYPSQADSLLALKGGNCVAAVHVSGTLRLMVHDHPDEWRDFSLPLAQDLIPSDGVVWVRKGHADIQAAIDAILRDLHGSGWMIAAAARNGLTADDFLRATQARFRK